ncbi:hypothetical protein DPEC_G00224040 [Dallia pectoralis]|uniref:Uncharacterized protein n=1 Tax=Dallia pectoralis TaxID=75939 RepID=A0ACC2FZR7_DALPE|nr:hypothetical protein DPEC_G00224040 [Dallia pectoralis]
MRGFAPGHPGRSMWTPCCSWSCLKTTATVEENGRSWRQANTNSGYSQSLTSPEHLCKACGGHFDAIARKHVCVDCKKSFCGHCSVQLEPPCPRLCHTCQRFHGTLFDRTQLMRLKVRELRDYLHLHEVPTQTCREKEELVELVLGQQTPSTSTSSETMSSQARALNNVPAQHLPSSPQAQGPSSPDTFTINQPEQLAPEAEPESEQISDEEDDDEEDEEDDEAEESSDSEETLIPGRRASLSDLSCVEDIEALSVRQLKEILARNFVNYKGCCEKWELMERVTRLYNNQKDLQNLVSNTKQEEDPTAPKSQEENLCRICMDSPIDCVLLECGHMVTCSKCGKRMSECPICRQIRQYMDPRVRLRSPFLLMGQQMQDITGDGGVLKEVVQPGEGQPVPRNASVSIHFSGFLEYSDRPFETTSQLKYPRMMKLGRDVTLFGLELGVLTMKKGEFSRFLFLPEYAYGDMGSPPLIPPAATVLYEVQVLDFLDSAQVDEFFSLSEEEQNTVPLCTLLNVVDTQRSFGNRCFNQSRFEDAKDRYKQALTLLGNRKDEEKSIAAALLPIYLNLSLTLLRLDRPIKALEYSQKALKIDHKNTKALFRCGQAYLELCDYEKAQDYLTLAQTNKPFDIDINNLLRKLAICYNDCLDKEKELCTKMFADFVKK